MAYGKKAWACEIFRQWKTPDKYDEYNARSEKLRQKDEAMHFFDGVRISNSLVAEKKAANEEKRLSSLKQIERRYQLVDEILAGIVELLGGVLSISFGAVLILLTTLLVAML